MTIDKYAVRQGYEYINKSIDNKIDRLISICEQKNKQFIYNQGTNY